MSQNQGIVCVVVLTDVQINVIVDELHLFVQFYDDAGRPANGEVLAQVRHVLRAAFLKKESLPQECQT